MNVKVREVQWRIGEKHTKICSKSLKEGTKFRAGMSVAC